MSALGEDQVGTVSPERAAAIGGRIARNTTMLGASRALAAAMGVATLVVTAKALDDPALFGTLLFIHAYMLFFAQVASFRSWHAIVRFGADDLHADDRPGLARLVRFAAALDALSAVAAYVLAVGLFGGFVVLAARWPSLGAAPGGLPLGTMQLYVAGYCSVVLFRQVSAAQGLCRLMGRFGALALRALVMPGLRLAGALAAWQMGWGIAGFLAVWFAASLASYLTLIALGWRVAKREGLTAHLRQPGSWLRPGRSGLWPFILKANADATLGAFKAQFPSILVMAVFGPALLAVYRIAEEVARLLSRAVTMLDQVLFPELSRLAADDGAALRRIVAKTAIGIGIGSLSITGLVVTLGPRLLSAGFGAAYAPSADLAAMLLVAAATLAIAAPFYAVFYVVMRPGRAIAARAVAVIAYVAAFFALAPRAGTMTPGWAALAAAIIELTLVGILAWRALAGRGGDTGVREP